MKRTLPAILGLVVVMALAGCSETLAGSDSGHVLATVVDDVPRDASVAPASDEHIADIEPLQEVIDRALRTNGSASVRVSGSAFRDVERGLGELEPYDGTGGSRGVYVRKDGTVLVVNLLKET